MICIKLINGPSNGKLALTQTQASSPKKLFLAEKLKEFIILRYVLLSHNPHIIKHVDIFLDAQLFFEEHLKVMIDTEIAKCFATTGINEALMKAFLRPYLNYEKVIYDEAYNETFHQKLESIQYNAYLALSRAIRGSSRQKNYQELGLESLQCQRWYMKLSLFYKIFKENKPVYLFNPIPTKISNYNTKNTDKITLFRTKQNFSKNSYFSSTVIEFSKKKLSKFIRPFPNSVFICNNCKGIKYLTRLRLGLSHLHEHKFKHSFQGTLSDSILFIWP